MVSPPIVVSQIVSPRFVLSLRDPRPLSFRKAPPLPNLVFRYILLRCLPTLCRFAKCLPTLCCFAKGPPALCLFAEGPPVLGRSAQVAPPPPPSSFRRGCLPALSRSAEGVSPPFVVPQEGSFPRCRFAEGPPAICRFAEGPTILPIHSVSLPPVHPRIEAVDGKNKRNKLKNNNM